MHLQKSFLKPFKKWKGKLPDSRREKGGRSGSEDNRRGAEVDGEGREASQRNSYLQSAVEVEDVVEGVPSREGSNVNWKDAAPVNDPPTSAPLISQSGKPDSA